MDYSTAARSAGQPNTNGRRLAAAIASVTAAAVLCTWKGTAQAAPPRPHGEAEIRATFGAPCGSAANDHRTNWAYGAWSGSGASVNVYGHSRLGREWNLARWWVANTTDTGGDRKLNYGIGAYDCRKKSGGSSQWSTHAWGIAIDTNSICNPIGQTFWNGRGYSSGGGCNGPNYGTALPDIWKANNDMLRINFAWGLAWDDPHHFQYATGY